MNIVLVHGAGGTPTTWAGVAPLLIGAGHAVSMVTNPMTSLDDDVANTTAAIDAVDGDEPVLLVGHSYGGAVITNAGRHPRVRGLVYVAAFGPTEGESVQEIVERYDPAEVSKHMRRGPNGEWAPEHTAAYWDEIAWDLTDAQRAIFDDDTRPSANEIFSRPTGVPAWRTLPSWYLVAAQDKTLRPDTQRDMAVRMGAIVSEVPGSHFTPVVRPAQVTELINQAVSSLAF
jgi:pimeloyl-ACP methyl ester carboxylesterase